MSKHMRIYYNKLADRGLKFKFAEKDYCGVYITYYATLLYSGSYLYARMFFETADVDEGYINEYYFYTDVIGNIQNGSWTLAHTKRELLTEKI